LRVAGLVETFELSCVEMAPPSFLSGCATSPAAITPGVPSGAVDAE
jgi:hypothetical protein